MFYAGDSWGSRLKIAGAKNLIQSPGEMALFQPWNYSLELVSKQNMLGKFLTVDKFGNNSEAFKLHNSSC